MREKLRVVFILSAERREHSKEENQEATAELRQTLVVANIPHKSVVGVYQTHAEHSFLVVGEDYEPDVYALGCAYGQESYLRLDEDRRAVEVSLRNDGERELGQWSEVSEHDSKGLTVHTYDPSTGRRWSVL